MLFFDRFRCVFGAQLFVGGGRIASADDECKRKQIVASHEAQKR